MAGRYGEEFIRQTIERYEQADREVYADMLAEFGERMAFLESAAGVPLLGVEAS
jgi:hypothetical protein